MNRTTPSKKCPECGVLMGGATFLDKGDRQPAPGDIAICFSCAAVNQYDDCLGLVTASDDAKSFADKDARCRVARQLILDRRKPHQGDRYAARCAAMREEVDHWRKENPALRLAIQYNFPTTVFAIATLPDALDKHLISVNEDARRMFASLGWLEAGPTVPSLFMVRMVMEEAFK